MSDQPQFTLLPAVQRHILSTLAGDVHRAQSHLAGVRPGLPPDGGEDDSSPPWRQALDSIELDRLPTLAEDLADPALELEPELAQGVFSKAGREDNPLRLPIQQALRDLLAILTPARLVCRTASPLARSCSEVMTVVANLLSATHSLLEQEGLMAPATTEPPEVHLLAGTRLSRLQLEVAIAELRDGLLRFHEATAGKTRVGAVTAEASS